MLNPYQVLGVHRYSTDEEIKAAYLLAAKKYHPDTKKGNVDRFKDVTFAYSLLKNKRTRSEYTDKLICTTPMCNACGGSGVTTKTVSMTERKYLGCKDCSGSGFKF